MQERAVLTDLSGPVQERAVLTDLGGEMQTWAEKRRFG